MASAKFANRTVNQSQSVICRLNLNAAPPLKSSAVVITLPISTTNITGLPIIVRGWSLRTASHTARRTIIHSQTALLFLGFLAGVPRGATVDCGIVLVSSVAAIVRSLEGLACQHQQMLQNRAQAQCGEKCQSADDQDHSD